MIGNLGWAVRRLFAPEWRLVAISGLLMIISTVLPALQPVLSGRIVNALVADAIHGQRQVVIKSLEQNYQQVEGVAAATILGDGRVALILDVDAVINLRRREPPRPVEIRPVHHHAPLIAKRPRPLRRGQKHHHGTHGKHGNMTGPTHWLFSSACSVCSSGTP